MLATPEPARLENVSISVPLHDDAAGSVVASKYTPARGERVGEPVCIPTTTSPYICAAAHRAYPVVPETAPSRRFLGFDDLNDL